jgi:diphthine synthase
VLLVIHRCSATTHHDLLLRAAEEGIRVETIHNASIMNAVAQTGLQLYQFGQTVSLCFFRDNWRPDSFYPKIAANTANNFHTLCLLDIKVKEQSFENMAKGVKVYEPPRYMSVTTAIEQLLEVEEKRKEKAYTADTLAFGVARLGQASQQIVSGTLAELLKIDFGLPLHSLVLAAPELHELELAMFEYWHWDKVARGAKRKAERKEREEREAAELAERMEKLKAEEAARPPAAASSETAVPARSTIPKAKTPVKASSSAPVAARTGKDEDSDDDDGVAMEPLF